MNRVPSDIPPEFVNLRKRDFLERAEANLNEDDRPNRFNAAYRKSDREFTGFLIPPGKRVLEPGCGQGTLLVALAPSYGVDFGAKTIARTDELHPNLHFVQGDVEDPATLAQIEGPFDYIVIADTIGMFEDIHGTLRQRIICVRHRPASSFPTIPICGNRS